jgi:mannan polymerase II complex MNN10 subunit
MIVTMLHRSLRVPPSLLLLVAFLVFFGWQFSQGPRHEHGPVGSQVVPGKAPRIALMTFVTEQRSYLHISLKNKARKHPRAS